MYDDDEELKKKRRRLILVIIVILLLIIGLGYFLFTRAPGSLFGNGMSCKLKVVDGEKDKDGNYVSPVTIGFEKATPEDKITKKVIGLSESDADGDTYVINKSGTVTVKGFVYNEKNQVATCSLPVSVAKSTGKCVLEVTGGTMGENNWYLTNVNVKLTTIDTGDLTISKYYVHEKNSEIPNNNVDTYTVKNDGTTSLEAVVYYSSGKTTTCTLEVKKDSTKPTCGLNFSGTKNAKGQYTSNINVTIKDAKDANSGVSDSGFGSETNHEDQEIVLTENKTHNVVGYVRDKAGNIGSCTGSVTKVAQSSGGSGGSSGSSGSGGSSSHPATVVKSNNKMCALAVTGANNNGVYTQNVVVSFQTLNDGVASTNITVDGKSGSDVVYITGVTSKKSYKAVGTATYSNGQTVTCTKEFTIDPTQDVVRYFLVNAKVGDKVNYTAGKYSSSSSVGGDGSFGGYSSGQSKEATIRCASGDYGSATGWRVFMVNGSNVYLIHAGTPICFNHTNTAYYNALNALNSTAYSSQFINSAYARSARFMTWSDYGYLKKYSTTLLNTGSTYYLAGADNESGYSSSYLRSYYPNYLWGYVSSSGTHSNIQGVHGARPIVLLNTNVGATYSGGQWNLTIANRSVGLDDEDDSLAKEFQDDALTILIDLGA